MEMFVFVWEASELIKSLKTKQRTRLPSRAYWVTPRGLGYDEPTHKTDMELSSLSQCFRKGRGKQLGQLPLAFPEALWRRCEG